jgi:hypothetical protein
MKATDKTEPPGATLALRLFVVGALRRAGPLRRGTPASTGAKDAAVGSPATEG